MHKQRDDVYNKANRGKLIAINDMERLSIEDNILAKIKVRPMPVITLIIFGQPLAFYQLSLRHSDI